MKTKTPPLTDILNSFSLCCIRCDDGMQHHSAEQAYAAGWHDIEADPDGLGWTYLGVCPECWPDWNR